MRVDLVAVDLMTPSRYLVIVHLFLSESVHDVIVHFFLSESVHDVIVHSFLSRRKLLW